MGRSPKANILTTEQFKFWMKNKNLKRHQFETPLMKAAIQKKLKMGYAPEDLLKVIENYSRLAELGQAPGYGNWGLTENESLIAEMLADAITQAKSGR